MISSLSDNDKLSLLVALGILILFVIIVFASYLFRCQTIQEVGVAYSRLFTSFGFGGEYFSSTMTSLSMKIIDIIFLLEIF